MDVSPPAVSADPTCDLCGYPRTGLPAEALCPECGEPPPRLAEMARAYAAAAAADTLSPLSAAKLAHVRLVAAGLFLLVTSSITALGVTLVMKVGPITLPAVNVPAPKVHAAALIQRSIGGPPGPWGIAGTTAALMGLVGIWLLTMPRSVRADEEAAFSPRRLARWSAVLSAGAVLGVLLSGVDPYIAPEGSYTARLICLALLLCELPANGLLYFYLRRLAEELGDRRAAGVFERCQWLIPVLTAGAGAIVIYAMLHDAHRYDVRWPMSARVALSLYGAAAVATGAAASAGVLGLLGTCLGQTTTGWLARAGDALGRLPALLRAGRDALRRDPRRWAVSAGVVIWLIGFWQVSSFALAQAGRYWAYRGEVPLLDFVGPKVPMVPLSGDVSLRYEGRIPQNDLLHGALITLAAVWLMTWPARGAMSTARRRRLARVTRWGTVVMAGALLGLGVWADAQRGRPFHHPRLIACAIAPADAIATLLIYLHLAAVAAETGRVALSRRIRVLGITAALLGLCPLAWFAALGPNSLAIYGSAIWTLGVCTVQVAAMVAVTFLCAATLARFAWAMATDAGVEVKRAVVVREVGG